MAGALTRRVGGTAVVAALLAAACALCQTNGSPSSLEHLGVLGGSQYLDVLSYAVAVRFRGIRRLVRLRGSQSAMAT